MLIGLTRRRLILVIVAFLLFCPTFTAVIAQENSAPSIITQNKDQLRALMRIDPLYQELMQNLRSNLKDLESLNALGDLLTAYDFLDSAEKVFKTSIVLDASQPEAHNGLGVVYLRKGTNLLSIGGAVKRLFRADNYSKSIKEFEQALSLDPGYHEAIFHIAEAYMEKGFRAKGGDKNFLNASSSLEDLVEKAPGYPDAHYTLGRAYYETGNNKKAQDEFQKQIVLDKGHNLSKIYLGLSYYRNGEPEKATQSYLEAVAKLTDSAELEKIYLDFHWLLSDEEKSEYNQLPLKKKSEYIANYWHKNDPNVITAENERLLEHFRRVDYVKTRYHERNYRGYDDRGDIYLKYGEPYFWDAIIPGSTEFWRYNKIDNYLTYTFVEPLLSPGYRLVVDLEELRMIAVANAPPERFTLEFEEEPLDFYWSYAQFKGRDGSTDIELYTGVPHDQLAFEHNGESIRPSLEAALSVITSDNDRLFDLQRHYSVETTEEGTEKYLLTEEKLRLVPGEYTFGVKVSQDSVPLLGIYQFTDSVRDFSSNELMISSLKIGTGTRQRDFVESDTRDKLEMEPYPFPFVKKSLPLLVYFEIYNLLVNSDDRTRYSIEYSLERDKDQAKGVLGGVFRKIGGLFRGGGAQSISIKEDRTGSLKEIHELRSLDISSLAESDMILSVTITDNISGRRVTGTKPVQIIK